MKNIKPLHAKWPNQAYHYLKILFFGVQESSHNWSCKEAHSPIKAGESPFEEMQISLWLIITWKVNIIYLSIQTWHSLLMERVFYIYFMLRQGRDRYFLFFHQMITLQKLRKMLFHLKFLLWRYLNFCNFFPFHTFQIRSDRWKWNNLWFHKLALHNLADVIFGIAKNRFVLHYQSWSGNYIINLVLITNKGIFVNLFCNL